MRGLEEENVEEQILEKQKMKVHEVIDTMKTRNV